jgi:dolichyl-phosphate-mannose-protein mannosyltransferase
LHAYINTGTRNKLYNSTGFFFLCWAAHYLPFYLMGRQLFLHHYLPAHLASCLVTGALVEFVCNVDPVIDDDVVHARAADAKKKVPEKVKRGFSNVQRQLKGQGLYATWAATGLIMAVVVWGWYFFLPLTYGKPGLSVEEVNARKWLNYDLHFAK